MRCSFYLVLLCLSFFIACSQIPNPKSPVHNPFRMHNHLINETSPYLLQHAHNPVDWYPWGDEALAKAKKENKLLLVSIGYSACHWCHVMEHESFEDDSVASVMNAHFVCIKVDREERPDIDQVYMTAVQLIKGQGGWPLNCFALHDGRPVYGGTYFPKQQWLQVLKSIADVYEKEPEKALEYAAQLTKGIHESEIIKTKQEDSVFTASVLKTMYENWSRRFDNKEGGPAKAPKFPLPNNYQFLLRYAHFTNDKNLLAHVNLTLQKMAFGGIYDQPGGGFARYSTDELWKVPHFEKMLYDNAQLVSLYSEAYQATHIPLYKETVEQTLEFIEREMLSDEGAFYSALDADSEGEEGKFYVWTKEELKQVLGGDFDLLADYYNINNRGLWEHEHYILLRNSDDETFAQKHHISLDELKHKVDYTRKKLLEARNKRIRPGLDDKQLTSWNALMLKGYVDAYRVFGNAAYLKIALSNASFIINKQKRPDGGLWHNHKKGKSNINGFLEDYSFTIEAFIALYEATFDEQWLFQAKDLTDYVIKYFYNPENGMFFFNSSLDSALIARKTETMDNVIPASNSSLAKGLFYLGHYFAHKDYLNMSRQMLLNVKKDMPAYGSGYSNWAILMLHHISPFYEIAIAGEQAEEKRKELEEHYLPNKILSGSKAESRLPLLENKHVPGLTMIYVCRDNSCKLPVSNVKDAILQMK